MTDDEIAFLKSHNIDLRLVLEAHGMSRDEWRAELKKQGKKIAVGDGVAVCRAGHRMRLHAGHCFWCRPMGIVFSNYHTTTARVYILGSLKGRCIKIGMSNDDLDHRVANLRSQAYASLADWKLLAVSDPVENAGDIEQAAKSRLSKFQIGGSSNRAGVTQLSTEAFACTFAMAKRALVAALPDGHALKHRCALTELIHYEWKPS